MPVIIRLQNLPWSANSVDIRKFFQGLAIPDGGVHIVGGEKGDAFIAFASDEDARQAMARNNGVIRDSGIKLFLSSRNEMQRVIEQARSGITASEPEGAAMKSADNLTAKRLTASQTVTPASVTHTATTAPASITRARSRSPINRIQTSQVTSNNNSSLENNSAAQVRMQQEMVRHMIPSGPMAGLTPLPAPLSVPTGLRPQLMGYGVDTVPLNIEAQRQALGVEGMNWTRRGADFGNGRMPLPDVSRVENMYRPPLSDPRAAAGMDPRQVDLQASQIDLNGRRIAPPVGNISQPAFTGRLELRGLPFNVTPRDIQDFFRVGVGMFVPDDCIKILVDDRGLTTGGATVRMANESDLRAALELNGRLMNDRRIDVMPLLNDIPAPIDVSRLNGRPMAGLSAGQAIIPQTLPPPTQQAVQQQQPPQQQQSLPQRDYVIYMKGIPFNACTDRDVGNFFQGLSITEIVFEVDRHTGKPAGNAFVEFPTREAYEGALALNLRHMGRRYIEVFPTTRDDMEEARRVANNANPEKPTYCVNVTGLPPSITNADLTSYFKEFGAVPYAIHIMLKANGLNAGEAFLEFSTPEHQAIAASRDGDVISNSRISVKEVPFHIMKKIVRPFVPRVGPAGIRNGNDFRPNFDQERRPFARGDRFDDRRGGRGGGRGGGRISPNRRRDPFADPRCVVHASNVPYKATNDDLRAFFGDFATVDGGIERRMNERGLATPEARIAFRSSLEAERAVKTMHKKFIQGRPVFLRLAV